MPASPDPADPGPPRVAAPPRPALLAGSAAAALTAAAVGAAWALAERTGRPAAEFTRDVATVGGLPAYAGFVSQLGLLLWAGAAGAGACGALAARRDETGRAGPAGFAAGLGWLSAQLAADDAFLLHEAVLPALGVPEKAVLLTHAAVAAVVFLTWRRWAARSNLGLLALAAAGLGGSVSADQLAPTGWTLAEDAAKLLGVATWCGYVVLTAAGCARVSPPASTGAGAPA